METVQFNMPEITNMPGSTNEGLFAAVGLFAILMIVLPLIIVMIVSMWKIFTKAGEEGWKSIIPIYNFWILAEIAGKPGWWGLLACLAAYIPIVGGIISLILTILIYIGLSQNFGKEGIYAVGLLLLGIVFFPMLAFGSAEYLGEAEKEYAPQ